MTKTKSSKRKVRKRKVPKRNRDKPKKVGEKLDVAVEDLNQNMAVMESPPEQEPKDEEGLINTTTIRVYDNKEMEADFEWHNGHEPESKWIGKIVIKIMPLWKRHCRQLYNAQNKQEAI